METTGTTRAGSSRAMKTQLLGGAEGNRRIAIVLSTDDNIKESLRAFATSHALTGCFHGIGAVRHATIAFWNPTTREYEHTEIGEQAEVVSLIGNLALTRDAFKMHAHVVLGLRGGRTVGGHLVDGVVHPTLELLFLESTPTLRREKDSATGLDLLALP
jgi:predicted DNA-binding protein with PD1-like motif